MAVRDDRSDVKQTTAGFRVLLMVQSLTSAKSKFLSLSAIYSFYERGTMRFIAHPSCMVELSKQRQKEIYTNFVEDW